MVDEIEQDENTIEQRGNSQDLFKECLEEHHEEFWALMDKKANKAELIEKFNEIDTDFTESFIIEGEDREIMSAPSAWNALGDDVKVDFYLLWYHDPEIKAFMEGKGLVVKEPKKDEENQAAE